MGEWGRRGGSGRRALVATPSPFTAAKIIDGGGARVARTKRSLQEVCAKTRGTVRERGIRIGGGAETCRGRFKEVLLVSTLPPADGELCVCGVTSYHTTSRNSATEREDSHKNLYPCV